MKKISIIIPVYNESENIIAVIKNIDRRKFNVVVVDDGSTDDVYNKISKFEIFYLRHVVNLGKGAAMKTGSDYAFNILKSEAVIFLDGDGQHDPRDLSKFVKKLKNSDAVFGSRKFNRNMPFYRKIGNVLTSFLVNIFFGKYIKDIPCGFKAFKAQVYAKLKWESQGYSVELEICARAAKSNLKISLVKIDTKYLGFDKGMTILDIMVVAFKLIEFKLKI